MPEFPIVRLLASVAAVLALGSGLAACASADDSSAGSPGSTSAETSTAPEGDSTDGNGTSSPPGETPGESPTDPPEQEPSGPVLEVTITDDRVAPNAEEISLGVDEPLAITITSDRGGELHVHSKPEQYVEFDSGSSGHELVVVTPGEVEIEDHETGAVVAILRVG